MELLLEILPFVGLETHFALKGGTAINLFFRDLPRLSIDIDLSYLPLEDRNTTLHHISQSMIDLGNRLQSKLGLKVIRGYLNTTAYVCKLLVQRKTLLIKIETNVILRGHVFPCQTLTVL